jgi:serine/threonine-protein kinase RsbT
MLTSRRELIVLAGSEDVVKARYMVRARASELNFGLVDLTKLVTATSEIARNTVDYGGGGVMTVENLENEQRVGLRLTFEDHGPGITDITLALKDGYSTGRGLGLGLGGAKRLVNEFAIQSEPGKGTKIVLTRWKA